MQLDVASLRAVIPFLQTIHVASRFALVNSKCTAVCNSVDQSPPLLDPSSPGDADGTQSTATLRRLLRIFPNVSTLAVSSSLQLQHFAHTTSHRLLLDYSASCVDNIALHLCASRVAAIRECELQTFGKLHRMHNLERCTLTLDVDDCAIFAGSPPTLSADLADRLAATAAVVRASVDFDKARENESYLADAADRLNSISRRCRVLCSVANASTLLLAPFVARLDATIVVTLCEYCFDTVPPCMRARRVVLRPAECGWFVLRCVPRDLALLHQMYLFGRIEVAATRVGRDNARLHSLLALDGLVELKCAEDVCSGAAVVLSPHLTRLEIARRHGGAGKTKARIANTRALPLERLATCQHAALVVAQLPATVTQLRLVGARCAVPLDLGPLALRELSVWGCSGADAASRPTILTMPWERLVAVRLGQVEEAHFAALNCIVRAELQSVGTIGGMSNLTQLTMLRCADVALSRNQLASCVRLVSVDVRDGVRLLHGALQLPGSVRELKVRCVDCGRVMRLEEMRVEAMEVAECGNRAVRLPTTLTKLTLVDAGRDFRIENIGAMGMGEMIVRVPREWFKDGRGVADVRMYCEHRWGKGDDVGEGVRAIVEQAQKQQDWKE